MVICSFALNVQKNNNETKPNVFGFAPISISQDYMAPELKDNDFIIIQISKSYQKGDIVTYLAGKEYQTKQIVNYEIDPSNPDLITQYSLANIDGSNVVTVSPSVIYGKMVLKLSNFATTVVFFESPPGVIVLILFALFAIFLPEIKKLFVFDKKSKDANKK